MKLVEGAISSGFYVLLTLMKIDILDLQRVIIIGQFGKYLNVDSLIHIGVIPDALRTKVTYVGNSSKSGAVICYHTSGFATWVVSVKKILEKNLFL